MRQEYFLTAHTTRWDEVLKVN
ncbi:hypothetical protein F9K92_15750 [Stenotrophomonas rhizophila]|uniref:Uncharacterized protein n=1 Tax=Stenotrophomonas rhizophila TaxID=216778 RepID=A0A7V8CCE8_9GAMM|nr:hypothetical protein F9K92_15750 [Stenotrophomonas rhizophila]